jgi:uncharacterized protein (TIGR02147 family)
MKKTFTPDINQYSEILPFLQDFYTVNKENNKNFSYRYLAMKLKWSAPYINDLIKGRKKLSLKRALEFIELIELKGTSAERFLFLFLSDSDNNFSESQLNKQALSAHDSKREVKKDIERIEFEKYESLFDHYIFFYLDYMKGVWNAETFLKKLNFPIKPSEEFLGTCIARMIKNKVIKYNSISGLYEHLSLGGVVMDQTGNGVTEEERLKLAAIVKQERDYASSYLNYMHDPKDPRIFCSGIINLDKELFIEAQDRMFALRNFLYELDHRAQERIPSAKGPESRLWQFSMHMFSLFE